MKLIAKERFTWLWIVLFFVGMSLVSVAAVSSAVTIGEHYGGGIVFYVDHTGQHGLIAAKADIPEKFNWVNAKRECEESMEGGYDDWVLPNKVQLNQLYLHKDVVGGFPEVIFWSSSESDAGHAWCQNVSNGNQYDYDKSFYDRVRAVRSF